MSKLTVDEFVRLCDERQPNLFVCKTVEDALDYQGSFNNMLLVSSVKALMFWNSFCALRFSGITYITIDDQTNGDLVCNIFCEDVNGKEHVGKVRLIYENVCNS